MYFSMAFCALYYVLQVWACIKLSDAIPLFIYACLNKMRRLELSKAVGKMAMSTCAYNVQALAVEVYFKLLPFGFNPISMGIILALAAVVTHFSRKCLEMATRHSRTSSLPSPARPKSPAIDAVIRAIIIYMASKRRFTCGVTTAVGNTMQQLANLLLYFTLPASAIVGFTQASLR
jgi:hypothetical protein